MRCKGSHGSALWNLNAAARRRHEPERAQAAESESLQNLKPIENLNLKPSDALQVKCKMKCSRLKLTQRML